MKPATASCGIILSHCVLVHRRICPALLLIGRVRIEPFRDGRRPIFALRGGTAMSFAKILPVTEPAVRTTLKQRLVSTCFLSAVALAMFRWVWGIRWVSLEAAKWLFA